VAPQLFIGLMSGTSLDGIDVALVEFPAFETNDQAFKLIGTHFSPFTPILQNELLAIHNCGENELERSALLANKLSRLYADAVNQLLSDANMAPNLITAIGCHGQTIRHRPELGYTLQIGNPALVTELTGITVIADFRSRDIAAGGQGAPLVPAFHQAVFAHPQIHRVIINIGGIANLTNLPADGPVSGFDSGPGNMLMDAWIKLHLGKAYDESGNWAASGQVIEPLLDELLTESFFQQIPPKSTGRDLFNMAWLQNHLLSCYQAQDVQRTLLELTARSIATASLEYCGRPEEVYICGGGAHNSLLLQRLEQLLAPAKVGRLEQFGIHADSVEAVAFAWLARQTMHGATASLPQVTGAKGARILGAIYTR
jgi:anhydro-N-acetylmuramic acid kinase